MMKALTGEVFDKGATTLLLPRITGHVGHDAPSCNPPSEELVPDLT
jgi:hypothetical protein